MVRIINVFTVTLENYLKVYIIFMMRVKSINFIRVEMSICHLSVNVHLFEW